MWYLKFDDFMTSHGFTRCSYDCRVYFKQLDYNKYIYLLLYVDDILIAYKDKSKIDALKSLLRTAFDMKDFGGAKTILRMDIVNNRSGGLIFFFQEKYIQKVLPTFDMEKSKPVQVPLVTHFKLYNLYCPKIEEKLEMIHIPYASVVECLMYTMVLSRPDISHAVSIVNIYMASPGKEH